MASRFLESPKRESSDSTTTEQSRDCFFYLVDRCKYVKSNLKHRDVDLNEAELPAWQKMAAQIIYEERRRSRNLETQVNELKTRNRKLYHDVEDLEEDRRLQNKAYDDLKGTLDTKSNECDQLRGQYNAQVQFLNESTIKINELEKTLQILKQEKSYRDTLLNYNPSSVLHPYSQAQPYPYYGGYYPNPPTTSNSGLFYYTPPLQPPDPAAQMQAAQTQATQAQAQAQVAQIQATQVQAQVTQNLHYPSPITSLSHPQPAYGPQQTSYPTEHRYKPY